MSASGEIEIQAESGTIADDDVAGARESLVRALASEGRTALSRVELAASELSRSGLAPSLAGRVATIREAVGEIEALLGKIDLLSDGERVSERAALDLGTVARGVVERVAPGLRARGVALVWSGSEHVEARGCVFAPRPTLEILCLGLVRLLSGALAGPASARGDDGSVRSIELGTSLRRDEVCLVARCPETRSSLPLDRTARLELEVVLAEWHGRLLVGETVDAVEVGFALPGAHEPMGPRMALENASR